MNNKFAQVGSARYGHMGVNTPDSDKIFKKLYLDTPVNRKLNRVGKPYGYVSDTSKKSPRKSPKNQNITRKQKERALKSLGKLRKDYKKCHVGYKKGKNMSKTKLAKLYKNCNKYSPKLIKKKSIKRSDLIGTKKSPTSGALRKYSKVIRKKLLEANKILIDYQRQQSQKKKSKKEKDDVIIEKVVSNSEKIKKRLKKAKKDNEIIIIDSTPKKTKSGKKRTLRRKRSSKR